MSQSLKYVLNRHSSDKNSSQKHSKPSKSHDSSASNSQSANRTRHSSGHFPPTNSFNYNSVHLNGNIHSYDSDPTKDEQAFYNQQYSTEVISGCTSLGVEVPTSMHQSLVDQHGYSTPGEFSYSTVMISPQYALDSQQVFVDGTAADRLYENDSFAYEYTWKKDDLQGDLAGIGAQFEGPKTA
ncbi:hypothetical protein N431DRAFT_516801 [Stipitochalara longipes BDJ]|nr:hypothetical protein N431DRAFT_516801 [Stipitochalara longipes BDJ]